MNADGYASSTLSETYTAAQAWTSPFGTKPPPDMPITGSMMGTHSRTETDGNAYTLIASQDYLLSGTTIAAGSDTYSLHSSDTTVAHDEFSGTGSGGNNPLFNGPSSALIGGTSPSDSSSLSMVDDAGYAVDRY